MSAYDAAGDAAPLRTIAGSHTGLSHPLNLQFDAAHNEILVSNGRGGSVTVFARDAAGDVAPRRTLAEPGQDPPFGVGVDPAHDEIFISSPSRGTLSAYDRTASGAAALRRRVDGRRSGVATATALAVAPARGELFLGTADFEAVSGAIGVYATGASGDTVALR